MTEIRTNSSGLRLIENSQYRLGCDSTELNFGWDQKRTVADMNDDDRDELFLVDTADPLLSAYYESLGRPRSIGSASSSGRRPADCVVELVQLLSWALVPFRLMGPVLSLFGITMPPRSYSVACVISTSTISPGVGMSPP